MSKHTDHTGWMAIGTAQELTSITSSGNYYLTGDVTLTENEAWKPADGVVLCLNGHSITSERSVNSIIVKQSVTFTLTDCKGIGTIPNFNIAIWHGASLQPLFDMVGHNLLYPNSMKKQRHHVNQS